MNEILKFLESINDGEVHELKNKDAFDVLNGKNDEVLQIMNLKNKGLVGINTGMINGHPAITGYYLTDKGSQYIKDHTSKFGKNLKKIF